MIEYLIPSFSFYNEQPQFFNTKRLLPCLDYFCIPFNMNSRYLHCYSGDLQDIKNFNEFGILKSGF